jgi:hypothetical protein
MVLARPELDPILGSEHNLVPRVAMERMPPIASRGVSRGLMMLVVPAGLDGVRASDIVEWRGGCRGHVAVPM